MKKIFAVGMLLTASTSFAAGELIISFVMDGDLPGGYPKIVELHNVGDTDVDLQDYKVAFETNGETSYRTIIEWTSVVTIPADSYYVLAIESTSATAVIGYVPDKVASIIINGDDRVALLAASDDSLLDLVGELGVDGDGTAWAYKDSYMFRNGSVTTANTTWTASEWTLGGVGALDGFDEATHYSMFNSDTGYIYKITTLSGSAPPAPTQVANIAAGLAEADSTEIQITGTVTVISATNGLNVSSMPRNQFFIQDATGALLIDDVDYDTGADVAIGDGITDLTVTLDTYYGTRMGISSDAPTIGTGTGPAISPAILTGSEILDDILSTLIRVNGVTINETGTFTANTTYDLIPAVGPVTQIRIEDGSELVGDVIPAGSFDLIGICTHYDSVGQVQPRVDSDLSRRSFSAMLLY